MFSVKNVPFLIFLNHRKCDNIHQNFSLDLIWLHPNNASTHIADINNTITVHDAHSLTTGDLIEPSVSQDGDNIYFLYSMSSISDGFHLELKGVRFPAKGSNLQFGYSQNKKFSRSEYIFTLNSYHLWGGVCTMRALCEP